MREAWNEFLTQVDEAKKGLGNPEPIWYRGHSDARWKLVPNILRGADGVEGIRQEQAAFHEFRRIASRLFDQRNSDWETLFDMQHYWVPTRLLDWTEVLGIAVAFIVHVDYEQAEDSALFLLDPLKLNGRSRISHIPNVPDDPDFDYRSIYWDKRPFPPQYPIALKPTMQSDRLFAQRGVFTIHGDAPEPLEEQCPEAVRKVVLSREARDSAWEFLEYANLDEYSIYPDIVGMARHLRRKLFET